MSMISAQIDELRRLAGDGSMEWVTVPIRASVLRDAADTIWELRDDLQRTNAENARLRSELESVGTAAYLYGRSDLNDENARLRKLVQRMWPAFIGEKRATFADRLRVRAEIDELGVEVEQ